MAHAFALDLTRFVRNSGVRSGRTPVRSPLLLVRYNPRGRGSGDVGTNHAMARVCAAGAAVGGARFVRRGRRQCGRGTDERARALVHDGLQFAAPRAERRCVRRGDRIRGYAR